MTKRLLLVAITLIAAAVAVQAEVPVRPYAERFTALSDGNYLYEVVQGDDFWRIADADAPLWRKILVLNPEILNKDLIFPGQRVRVLAELRARFDAAMGEPAVVHVEVKSASQTQTPQVVASGVSWGALLAALVVLGILAYLVEGYRLTRRRNAEQRQRADEDLRNPYTGPPVIAGGMQTVDEAAAFFAGRYRDEREAMPVREERQLPRTVTIVRIIPVEVTGQIEVRDANGVWTPKVLTTWEPAWQCELTDGAILLALRACANDVRSGGGARVLPGTQVRARQYSQPVEINLPVWTPADAPRNDAATQPTAPAPDAVAAAQDLLNQEQPYLLRSVELQGPGRAACRLPDGSTRTVDVTMIPKAQLHVSQDVELVFSFAGLTAVVGVVIPAAVPSA